MLLLARFVRSSISCIVVFIGPCFDKSLKLGFSSIDAVARSLRLGKDRVFGLISEGGRNGSGQGGLVCTGKVAGGHTGGVSIMEPPLLLQSPWLIELVVPVFAHVRKEKQIGTERLDAKGPLDSGFGFEGVEPKKAGASGISHSAGRKYGQRFHLSEFGANRFNRGPQALLVPERRKIPFQCIFDF